MSFRNEVLPHYGAHCSTSVAMDDGEIVARRRRKKSNPGRDYFFLFGMTSSASSLLISSCRLRRYRLRPFPSLSFSSWSSSSLLSWFGRPRHHRRGPLFSVLLGLFRVCRGRLVSLLSPYRRVLVVPFAVNVVFILFVMVVFFIRCSIFWFAPPYNMALRSL